MTKVLLIGVGRWGANHLRVLRSLPIDLFVSDLDPKLLGNAAKLGISSSRLAVDYRKFLDPIDAAIVVTPAQTHFDLAAELLQAGKDVFVEKPMALSSAHARALVELAREKARIFQVGHIFRFDTASEWLRGAIQAGRFGRINILRSNFSGFKRPRQDSGVTLADAVHFIDLFNYLLGCTPVRVTAILKDFLGRGMDDASLLSLEYATPSGATWGIVETNYFLPGKFREITIVGSELSAICDYNVSQYKIRTFANKHVRQNGQFKAEEGPHQYVECSPEEPLRAELRAFVDSITARQAPRADGVAGYEAVRVIEAAMASAAKGCTIELKRSGLES